jgi:hypothetical protein
VTNVIDLEQERVSRRLMRFAEFKVEEVEPHCWQVWQQGIGERGTIYSPDAKALAHEAVLKMCRGQMLDHGWCSDPLWLQWWEQGA